MSLDTPASKKFTADFQAMYGADRVTGDPAESAYNMVYLWKNAVEKAGTFEDLDKVRTDMIGITFAAPQGEIKMFPNHHTSERVLIGEAENSGQFKILYDSVKAIPPIPWNQFVPETKGYTCDWTQDRPDAGKFRM